MPFESISNITHHARQNRYAVGYFESWNLESLQGVVDAAEKTRSPVIIGFNGEFLSSPERLADDRLEWYAGLGRLAADTASVPCGLIFNECPRDAWVYRAIDLGFNLVMLADPDASYEDYESRVTAVAHHAHKHRVAVEAEIGQLPCGESGQVQGNGCKTDPELAHRLVQATGIDLLAVSVGNIHVLIEGERDLDLDHLELLGKKVSVPFVLHGGSGISSDSLTQAVALGVVKVNYGTYLKQRYLKAIRHELNNGQLNPHELLGIGRDSDMLVAGRHAVRDAVLERIEGLGCCGRAEAWGR